LPDIKHIGDTDWNKDIKKALYQMVINAAQIIRSEIKNGIEKGQDVKGNPFKRLKASTIRSKRKKKYSNPSKALWAEGKMKKLPPITRNKMKKEAVIKIAGSRIEAGFYHNEGGKHLPKREWFGVSKKAHKNIQIALKEKLKGVLRKSFK